MFVDDAKCPILLEVCVDDIAGVAAAIDGGADRIELCSALALGGLTPSPGLVAAAMALARPRGIAVHAMVRPRAGDFVYDPATSAIVCDDLRRLAAAGVDGLVFGASLPDGRLDRDRMEGWMAVLRTARSALATTLHRAIDLVPDLDVAVDEAIVIGFDHILSSGGAPTALAGAGALASMRDRAADRCAIIAGAGVSATTVPSLLETSGVRQVHASASVERIERNALVPTLGFGQATRRETDRAQVRALRDSLDVWQTRDYPRQ